MKYTFYKNGRTSFPDIISTDRGLANKHKVSKIPNVFSVSDHLYVLRGFQKNKTRRAVKNFKYSTKRIDPDNFILRFDDNFDKLFIQNLNDEEAHGKLFLQKAMEMTCASKLRKTYPPTGKKNTNYWCNEELKTQRIEILRKRRLV